jgi:LmbE family N-acetylglucosaminyl deacetylase
MTSVGATLAAFEALPFCDLAAFEGRTPLILAPHPDDETLGCGGLIAACCQAGIVPRVAILTDGAASHPGSLTYPPARLAAVREAEARTALGILGLPPEHIMFLRFPDAGMPRGGEAYEAALAALAGCCTAQTIVIGPWGEDPHCDHEAGSVFARALAEAANVALWTYPVWGWLRDLAQTLPPQRIEGVRLDIAAFLPAKRRAIAAHATQHGEVVVDSPQGFCLPPALLAIFARPYELFLRA